MTTTSTAKLTKQGVRDLGGNGRRRKRATFVCPHVWEVVSGWDCLNSCREVFERCGMCHAERR